MSVVSHHHHLLFPVPLASNPENSSEHYLGWRHLGQKVTRSQKESSLCTLAQPWELSCCWLSNRTDSIGLCSHGLHQPCAEWMSALEDLVHKSQMPSGVGWLQDVGPSVAKMFLFLDMLSKWIKGAWVTGLEENWVVRGGTEDPLLSGLSVYPSGTVGT